MHAGTAGLNTSWVTALVGRRQAGALLAAGNGGASGLAALRSAGACGLLTGKETPALCNSLFQLALAGCSCWPAAAIGPEENRILPSALDPALALTARQREVAAELVHGHSNKVIAATLGMTEGTVKIHLTAVYRTLGVSNRATALLRLLPILGAAARPVNSGKQSGDI
ncbi:DNA-binding two-component response regulator (plasmid) [Azospirillum sp. B510]|nr:DNA-binding two-component response regulator [Azospirillum sp. B510]